MIALVAATTALIVGVFTVLSITVSLRKEKIWGVTIGDFKKLMSFEIPFLYMMIIFLALTAINIIAMLFNCEIACIAISIISIVCAGFFCEQEISILIKREEKLWKIVRENMTYKKRDRSEIENDKEKEREKIIYNVQSHLLFEKNIKKVYEKLCCSKKDRKYKYEYQENNANFLDSLLDKQKDKLLKNKYKSLKLLLLEKNDTDIPIMQLYESTIENINLLLKSDKKFDVLDIIKKPEDDIYSDTRLLLKHINKLDSYIVQLLFDIIDSKINTIDNKNNIYEKLSDIFTDNIFKQLAYEEISDAKRDFLFKILTEMLSRTIYDGKDCFLNILYEFYKYYGDYESGIVSRPNISEFFIAICWFLYYTQIKEFPTTNAYTKEMISNFVNRSDKENYSWKELYQKFTEFGYLGEYSNFNIKVLLDIREIIALHNVVSDIDNNIIIDNYLSEKSLLDWFFEMLFSSNCLYRINPQKIFENCSKKKNFEIAYYLKLEWIDDNKIKEKLLEKQIFHDSNRNNIEQQENFNDLIAWVDERLIDSIKAMEDISDAFLIEQKKYMIERVNDDVKKLHCFNDEIDFSNEPINGLENFCYKTQNEMFVKAIIDSFVAYLENLAKEATYIKIDEEKSQVRALTDEEINEKIDSQFKRKDGLYFYKEYKCNIFTTREEVFDIIKKKHFVMQLAYRIKKAKLI
jgi:hypothetical protein